MNADPAAELVGRILRRAALCAACGGILVYVLSRALIYSIILLLAAALAMTGFWLLAKSVNRLLRRGGGGKALFFGLQLAKLAVIAATFVAVARISEAAVLAYLAGISMVVIAGMIEGLQAMWRSFFHGT